MNGHIDAVSENATVGLSLGAVQFCILEPHIIHAEIRRSCSWRQLTFSDRSSRSVRKILYSSFGHCPTHEIVNVRTYGWLEQLDFDREIIESFL